MSKKAAAHSGHRGLTVALALSSALQASCSVDVEAARSEHDHDALGQTISALSWTETVHRFRLMNATQNGNDPGKLYWLRPSSGAIWQLISSQGFESQDSWYAVPTAYSWNRFGIADIFYVGTRNRMINVSTESHGQTWTSQDWGAPFGHTLLGVPAVCEGPGSAYAVEVYSLAQSSAGYSIWRRRKTSSGMGSWTYLTTANTIVSLTGVRNGLGCVSSTGRTDLFGRRMAPGHSGLAHWWTTDDWNTSGQETVPNYGSGPLYPVHTNDSIFVFGMDYSSNGSIGIDKFSTYWGYLGHENAGSPCSWLGGFAGATLGFNSASSAPIVTGMNCSPHAPHYQRSYYPITASSSAWSQVPSANTPTGLWSSGSGSMIFWDPLL